MKSNIQFKYSNYAAFSRTHRTAVNNLGLYYAQKKESERIREIVKEQREERAQKEESNAADDLGETEVAVDTTSVYDTSGELLGDFIKKEDGEKSGITYSWNDSGCYIAGTAIAPSAYNVFSSKNSLPKVFVPGKTYYMISNIHMPYTWVRMVWYKSNGETEQDKFGFSNGAGEFTVPADAVGLVVRFSVDSGSSVDGQVGLPEVYLCEERKLKVPLLVTFIDDDTSNDEYIHRYYENCKHNGITGNYAVITSHIEEGKTSLQNLLNYESDGFGMLVHCYAQNSSWREEDIAACSENLEKALTQMDEYGFHNYNPIFDSQQAQNPYFMGLCACF